MISDPTLLNSILFSLLLFARFEANQQQRRQRGNFVYFDNSLDIFISLRHFQKPPSSLTSKLIRKRHLSSSAVLYKSISSLLVKKKTHKYKHYSIINPESESDSNEKGFK
jgi:predicted kinase